MARYFKKRRFGGRYGKKKRYSKMGYRKMKRSKAKLYRQGGNFAASGSKPSVELKSFDNLVTNIIANGAANSIGAYAAQCDAYSQAVTAFNAQFPNPPYPTAMSGVGFYEPNNIAVPVCLNSMTVGPAVNQRLGRKVTMRSIKVDILLQAPGTLASQANLGLIATRSAASQVCPVRIILAYDRQTNSAPVAARDVLAPPGQSGISGGGSAVSVCSSNNLNNRSRFLTLYDKTHYLSSLERPYKLVQIYKKMNLPVIFSASTPTTPWDWNQIQTGALFLMMISDGDPLLSGNINADSTASPSVLGQVNPYSIMPCCRLRFTDA